MNYLKSLIVLATVIFATGCAGSARQDYYLAMQQTAAANAAQAEARYRALATVASQGDPSSQIAATMAIALTQDKTIAPQYVESEGLSWARVLANPIATLGMAGIQAGVSKNASDNAAQVQMASYASNEAIQLGQQNMVSTLGSQWGAGAAASSQQLVDLGVAGFTALNTAGEQTVTLGVAGLSTADSIAGAGFTANENIATAGFNATTTVAGLGFATADSIATTGFTTVGAMSADYNTLLNNVSTTHAGTLVDMNASWSGALVDTNATNLAGQTNYAQAIADMQATISAMAADLGQTVVCADDGTGSIVCN